MPAPPKIHGATVADTENGVILRFSLNSGLEPTNELGLWCRARIQDSTYYQPLDLNIMPGGMTAEAVVEPGKVQRDPSRPDKSCYVDVQWYFEAYPERERSDIVSSALHFRPDWIDLPAFESELRSLFIRKTVEGQATEAARFKLLTAEDVQKGMYNEAALNFETGLWMVVESRNQETVGISPDQPTEGYDWRVLWFQAVLDRRAEILAEEESTDADA